MRTVEVIFVIAILLGAFAIATQFAILPSPQQAFGTNLRDLSKSTLETLDAQGVLSETIFKENSDPAWGNLQKAISASLPPNLVYNLSVYDLSEDSGGLVSYQLINSISDIGFGANSEAASFIVTSPDVTFTQDPQKIGESYGQNITLYILNCEDANGWWITGYTGQSLTSDLYNLLGQYFETTVFINNTDDFQLLLENSSSLEGNIQNAVVINTFGESVPIPDEYCLGGTHDSQGYGADRSYARYCYTLGTKTREYNWTWISIVGYPLYYVSNTEKFANNQNTFGIYGMTQVGPAGLNSFLGGLDNQDYQNSSGRIDGSPGDVTFNNRALENINYYGIYPHPTQTSTRALDDSILEKYDLSATEIFNRPSSSNQDYIPAAIYTHNGGGALAAIGLTRIPDIRVTALALLMYYSPTIYRNDFGASGTSRLVTLQLGQQGGT
jgi:hypothetical protein